MKALIQRVLSAKVSVAGDIVGEIDFGMLILLGIAKGDSKEKVVDLADKVTKLRIFEDEEGKMNRSIIEAGGKILVVSQFTLLAETKKGNRPSFVAAADPHEAKKYYEQFIAELSARGIIVGTGQFQAKMNVTSVNAGPVTIMLEL